MDSRFGNDLPVGFGKYGYFLSSFLWSPSTLLVLPREDIFQEFSPNTWMGSARPDPMPRLGAARCSRVPSGFSPAAINSANTYRVGRLATHVRRIANFPRGHPLPSSTMMSNSSQMSRSSHRHRPMRLRSFPRSRSIGPSESPSRIFSSACRNIPFGRKIRRACAWCFSGRSCGANDSNPCFSTTILAWD
jgi:hypothetical protein